MVKIPAQFPAVTEWKPLASRIVFRLVLTWRGVSNQSPLERTAVRLILIDGRMVELLAPLLGANRIPNQREARRDSGRSSDRSGRAGAAYQS
jgi:hypothetical protein